jgi:hypothetical protein
VTPSESSTAPRSSSPSASRSAQGYTSPPRPPGVAVSGMPTRAIRVPGVPSVDVTMRRFRGPPTARVPKGPMPVARVASQPAPGPGPVRSCAGGPLRRTPRSRGDVESTVEWMFRASRFSPGLSESRENQGYPSPGSPGRPAANQAM